MNNQTYARILYPFWVLFGVIGIIYVPSTLINLDNAALTAQNISENKLLFRFGILSSIISSLIFIIIPFLLFQVFKNHGKAALFMFVLALVSVPISLQNEGLKLSILEQLHEPGVVMSILRRYNEVQNIATIFWGLWLFPLGYLVTKTYATPKLIGYLLYVSGAAYLMAAIIRIINPEFNTLNLALEMMTMGEVIFLIWFVVKGFKKETTL